MQNAKALGVMACTILVVGEILCFAFHLPPFTFDRFVTSLMVRVTAFVYLQV
jgi:hypothetical protein